MPSKWSTRLSTTSWSSRLRSGLVSAVLIDAAMVIAIFLCVVIIDGNRPNDRQARDDGSRGFWERMSERARAWIVPFAAIFAVVAAMRAASFASRRSRPTVIVRRNGPSSMDADFDAYAMKNKNARVVFAERYRTER